MKRGDGTVDVKLHDQLVCFFEDKFSDPYYSMKGEELIYWGPNNARTVGLSLIATHRDATADDIHGTKHSYDLVLSLYEEDGRWLRTLAIMPWADYVGNGMIVFEGPGIALLTRDPFDPRFEALDRAGKPGDKPSAGAGSKAGSGSEAASGRTTPAPQGHSQPTQHGSKPAASTPAGSNSRAEQAKAAQEKKAEEERRAAEEKKAAEEVARLREMHIVRLQGEPAPHTLSALEGVR